MKNLSIIFALAFLFACKKEDIKPEPTNAKELLTSTDWICYKTKISSLSNITTYGEVYRFKKDFTYEVFTEDSVIIHEARKYSSYCLPDCKLILYLDSVNYTRYNIETINSKRLFIVSDNSSGFKTSFTPFEL